MRSTSIAKNINITITTIIATGTTGKPTPAHKTRVPRRIPLRRRNINSVRSHPIETKDSRRENDGVQQTRPLRYPQERVTKGDVERNPRLAVSKSTGVPASRYSSTRRFEVGTSASDSGDEHVVS